MEKIIYLDTAATTQTTELVVNEMIPFFGNFYGNANSLHKMGIINNNAITNARIILANDFNCNASEIYFTSGGTESNNWAIKGFARANKNKGNNIIVSSIEHDSILESAKSLEKEGFSITYVKPTKDGHISVNDIEKNIRKDTILISVMAVNNETGCIQPINEICKLAHKYKIAFHTDFVQSLSINKPDVKKIKADMISISAHKIHGPKGIGALYIKKGVKILDLIDGGSQENHRRGGTSNVPLIVGFGKSIELNSSNRMSKRDHLLNLKTTLINELSNYKINFSINGSNPKVDNILNISFVGIDAEGLLHLLSEKNVCVSVGSACNSTNKQRSHVLKSMNVNNTIIDSSLRFSFDDTTLKEDVLMATKIINETIIKLKKLKG